MHDDDDDDDDDDEEDLSNMTDDMPSWHLVMALISYNITANRTSNKTSVDKAIK